MLKNGATRCSYWSSPNNEIYNNGDIGSGDSTPPTTAAVLSGTAGEDDWYRSDVQVTLTAADDSGGSGVKRIYVKWDDGTIWLWYINPFTISGEGVHTVTYKAEDNAGNVEAEKQTFFGIDSTAPTGSLGINNDASVTHATLVSLNTTTADNLSGVSQMRVRDAGDAWDDWQSYTAAPLWLLPGPTGQTFGVGVQFKDRAGNESGVYTDTIPLDIYPDQPASAGYRLQKTTLGASGGPSVSTSYQLRGTLGQPSAVSVMSDTTYIAAWGYWRTSSVASPAQAGFTATPISGVAPLTVTFVSTSTGDYDSSLWNFGDGVSSVLLSPTHIYTSAGVYTVSLTVSGAGGTDTLTRAHYITATASPIPVQANFTASPLAGQPPLTVAFTDTSGGDITTWQWDFGDGSSSATQNPDHAYAAAGSYTVTLTVNGPNGSDAEVKTDYIQVSNDSIIANFTANPTSGEAPLNVQFTDVSSGNITIWLWNFGDGGSSALQNPSHIYQGSGVYTVSLFVNGLGGTGNLVKTGYISITPASVDNNIYLPLILK